MIKILTIIGARPQIIKAAALSRAISDKYSNKIKEVILHTGQHYDENMSGVFFEELGIPEPDINLEVGSGSHAEQTAKMLTGIEKALVDVRPDAIVIYGDTNSTVAGALAAAKIHVPVAHVEAGLRSFDKTMPEEVNRILSDHVSTFLFVPTRSGIVNLEDEGFRVDNNEPYGLNNPLVSHVGDVMYDNSLHFVKIAQEKSTILKDMNLIDNEFHLSTIHRSENTDDPSQLEGIFRGLIAVTEESGLDMVLPLHPRTRKMLQKEGSKDLEKEIRSNNKIHLINPVSFLDMMALEAGCKCIFTDSGGVQKESFYFKKPCVVLRPHTEWTELIENGNAIVADADHLKIVDAWQQLSEKEDFTYPDFYGDGDTAYKICKQLFKYLR